MKIEPGFYPNLSNEDYHASNGISKSGLTLINRSPKHYYDAYLKEDRVKKEQTPQMILGSFLHCYILEENEVENRYACIPKIDRRTKQGKEEHYKVMQEISHKTLISFEDSCKAENMAYSVLSNQTAVDLINNGSVESSIYFKDSDYDVLCKCRPDVMFESYVVDLKTTSDASHEEFSRQIYKYGYHIQSAIMQEGIFKQFGTMIKDFFFVCVETIEPYCTAIYRLDDDSIHKGRQEYKRLLKIYKGCMESNQWEGYKITEIGLPRWAR